MIAVIRFHILAVEKWLSSTMCVVALHTQLRIFFDFIRFNLGFVSSQAALHAITNHVNTRLVLVWV